MQHYGGVKIDGLIRPPVTVISVPNNTTRDTTVYTVTAGNTLNLHDILVTLTEAIVGAGTAVLTIGATAGGQEYILATAALSSATPLGVVAGQSLLSLGTSMLPANGFRALIAEGGAIVCRIVSTGAITAGTVDVQIEARLLM
jgi:hypothetical protein